MSVEFSDHAQQQLLIRKIPKSRVIETIQNPDEAENSFRKRVLYRKRYTDKILEVIAITEHKNIIIVTAYYLKTT